MAEVVYLLCAATSVTCAVLLLRGYLRQRTRLLLWSSLCFVLLGVNNLLLFADLILFPDISFVLMRGETALIGVMLLLFGLIWEAR
jgi:hypothetical protein